MSEGLVTGIMGQTLIVAVKCATGCATCAKRDGCGIAGLAAKQVRVDVKNPQDYRVGQTVALSLENAAVGMSLFFAFVLPTVLVVTVLLMSLALGIEDTVAAFCGLGAAVAYALFLRLINFWLERRLKIIVD